MPTNPSKTYGGAKLEPFYPGARTIAVVFGASLTIAAGTVLGIKTADEKYYAYATGAADGTEVARAIAVYDMKTDANGKVSLGDATPGEIGADELTAPVYVDGCFDIDDLTGLDAAAIADLGRVIEGVAATGILKVY